MYEGMQTHITQAAKNMVDMARKGMSMLTSQTFHLKALLEGQEKILEDVYAEVLEFVPSMMQTNLRFPSVEEVNRWAEQVQ